jgi:DNA-binding PadR family transcriptional regulator
LEERSGGFYSASPGVIYPTLTFLEEAGHAVSASEGSRKVFSITEAGRALLDENRHAVEQLFHHLERFGRKMARAREWFGWEEEKQARRGGGEGADLRAVRRRLRVALAEALELPQEKQAEALAILERAVAELEALRQD